MEADMKNILLLVHDDAGEEARMQAALDLVRAVSGHLTCLDVFQIPTMIGTDYMMTDATAVLLTEARDREAENRRRVKARLAGEDVAWNWLDATGDIALVLEEQSKLADLIVLNTALADHESPDMRATVSEVVMRSGKPILAVPEATRGIDASGHALIAWNGSSAIASTLRAVTPLLALASGVTIVQIGAPGAAPAEEAATYLSRHNIHARVERRDGSRDGVAETLLDLCKDRHPSYCVIGAYGHSRVREGLFGGVTRSMLAESQVPLILGH
jgi:nucleotide-binding universal stress UspA family protein